MKNKEKGVYALQVDIEKTVLIVRSNQKNPEEIEGITNLKNLGNLERKLS